MKLSRYWIGTAVLLLAPAVFGQAPAPQDDDLTRLQGTWLTVSLVNDGKTLVAENEPPKPGPVTKLAYEGNRWKVIVGNKVVATGVVKIDSTRRPKEIDLLDESGTRNETTKLGVYELDGDTYRYCLAPAGKPRPRELASPAGSGVSLGVSRRETS
jgi:uncharacterized protein (TIGR03067 family)